MENEMPSSLQALLRQLDEQGITDYRRYQQVRNYLEFKARDRNHPISGSFELTPLCNLDCKMCYVHLHKEQMHGRYSSDFLKNGKNQREHLNHDQKYLTGY